MVKHRPHKDSAMRTKCSIWTYVGGGGLKSEPLNLSECVNYWWMAQTRGPNGVIKFTVAKSVTMLSSSCGIWLKDGEKNTFSCSTDRAEEGCGEWTCLWRTSGGEEASHGRGTDALRVLNPRCWSIFVSTCQEIKEKMGCAQTTYKSDSPLMQYTPFCMSEHSVFIHNLTKNKLIAL